MTIENTITSYELSRKLKEQGVEQKSIWAWKVSTATEKSPFLGQVDIEIKRMVKASSIPDNRYWDVEYVSAYMAEELVRLLPENVYTYSQVEDEKRVFYAMKLDDPTPKKAESLAGVMAEYLLKGDI